MQAIRFQPPHRQRSLESQQSYHDPVNPNMQAQRQSLYKRIAARLRMTNIGLRKDNEVDNALTAAAERHERGDRFLTEYARISHRSQLYLHTMLDLFLREPLDTTTI